MSRAALNSSHDLVFVDVTEARKASINPCPDSKPNGFERDALMQALWFEDVGHLAWREVEDLVVGHPLEAIVRPVASTTCDLDRAIVHGLVPLGNNFPIGHECVAEVLEVGAAVHQVAVGDLVVVP